MDSPLVWAEVDLKAIAHNALELRRITKSKTGHGFKSKSCSFKKGKRIYGSHFVNPARPVESPKWCAEQNSTGQAFGINR